MKMELRRFALRAAGGYRGRDGDTAFAKALLEAFGAASHFDEQGGPADEAAFCSGLAKLGFDVMAPRREGLFVRIRALKSAAKPAAEIALRFRGHGG